MKLSDIISLNPNFKPYYDLKNEVSDYWSCYISNHQFEELLELILKSLYSPQKKDRLSTWFYGTYGTGKSHAIGVIKKLITSDWSDVSAYVESHIDDTKLVQEIKKRASSKEVFPVVLKGVSLINDAKSFKIAIENAVKEQLAKMNIILSTLSEFERYVEKIQKESIINWNSLIRDSNVLANERNIKNKEDLIKALNRRDSTVLDELNKALIDEDIQIANVEIVSWLKEVQQELSKKDIAQRIVIFWDEFTSIMDLHNNEILLQIQDIAELTPDNGVYLVIVSHKTHNADNDIERKEYEKIMGRFNKHSFVMQENTTYDLIAGTILKQDNDLWKELFNRNKEHIKNVISKVSKNNTEVAEVMNKMFPLHPYTAYVANYVSRQIGSTERSIFKFLYDENIGFLSFINECDDENNLFCTADRIFDFFLSDFENDKLEYVRAVAFKFIHNRAIFDEKTLPLFKGLLLLNITHRLLNAGDEAYKLLVPNEECLKLMFEGTMYSNLIPQILKKIDEKDIINRDYDERYIIDSGSIDVTKIDIDSAKSKYRKFSDLLNEESKENLISTIKTMSLRRSSVTEIEFIDDSESEQYIINRINRIKNNSKSFSMNILVFGTVLYNNNKNIDTLIAKWNTDNKGKDFKNIVFVSMQSSLTTETDFNKFISNKAKEAKSKVKSIFEEAQRFQKNSAKLLNSWVEAIKNSPIKLYLFDTKGVLYDDTTTFKNFYTCLENEISAKINHKSFDVLSDNLSVNTIWKKSNPEKIILHYLESNSLEDLFNGLSSSQYKQTLGILKDAKENYIVGSNLKLTADINHPLCDAINLLKSKLVAGRIINLKDDLEEFFQPPFSYYNNHVFFAVFGYIFREYKGKLINSITGNELDILMLQKVLVSIFKAHCDNRSFNTSEFEFTIGSPMQKEFSELVGSLFNISDVRNVQELKLKLMSWFKENHPYPLWLYKYDDNIDENLYMVINDIVDIIDRNYQSDPLQTEDFERYLQCFNKNKKELQTIFKNSNEEKTRPYFEKYFTSSFEERYNPEDYGSLFDHVKRSSQGDIYRLTKDNAEKSVYEWFYLKSSSETKTGMEYQTYPALNREKETVSEKVTHNKFLETKSIINQYQGDFKNIVNELLKVRPEISETILNIIQRQG